MNEKTYITIIIKELYCLTGIKQNKKTKMQFKLMHANAKQQEKFLMNTRIKTKKNLATTVIR